MRSLNLATKNLLLRPFEESDAEDLYSLCCQREITDLLPDWKISLEQSRGWIGGVIKRYENPKPRVKYIVLALATKEDGKLIGWCGVGPKKELNGEVEISYAISKDYRNMGYVTEASKAIIEWTFSETDITKVIGIALPHNMASNRVLQKTGFSYLSQKEVEHDGHMEVFNYYVIEK